MGKGTTTTSFDLAVVFSGNLKSSVSTAVSNLGGGGIERRLAVIKVQVNKMQNKEKL